VSVKGLTMNNPICKNTNGTSPQAGIDLEPDYTTQFMQGVVINNPYTENNVGYGICFGFDAYSGSVNPITVTINNHKDIGSGASSYDGQRSNYFKYTEDAVNYDCTVTVNNPAPVNAPTNFLLRGNFPADFATSWAASSGAVLSAASNILSVTGNSSGTIAMARNQTAVATYNGQKVFLRAKMKVTNSVCDSFKLAIYNGDTKGKETLTPSINVQSTEYINLKYLNAGSADMRVDISHTYADGTEKNGKVMEVQEVVACDLTAAYAEGYVPIAGEFNAAYPDYF